MFLCRYMMLAVLLVFSLHGGTSFDFDGGAVVDIIAVALKNCNVFISKCISDYKTCADPYPTYNSCRNVPDRECIESFEDYVNKELEEKLYPLCSCGGIACNLEGTLSCHNNTCVCGHGITGITCDECSIGSIGIFPRCDIQVIPDVQPPLTVFVVPTVVDNTVPAPSKMTSHVTTETNTHPTQKTVVGSNLPTSTSVLSLPETPIPSSVMKQTSTSPETQPMSKVNEITGKNARSEHNNNMALILGSSSGGLLVIIGSIIILVMWRRKHRKTNGTVLTTMTLISNYTHEDSYDEIGNHAKLSQTNEVVSTTVGSTEIFNNAQEDSYDDIGAYATMKSHHTLGSGISKASLQKYESMDDYNPYTLPQEFSYSECAYADLNLYTDGCVPTERGGTHYDRPISQSFYANIQNK